jgi:hypothetical protein
MKRTSLLAFALVVGVSAPVFGITVLETFDTDPAARGWAGVDNLTPPQAYGFSTGDVTGTAVNPPGGMATGGGEMGGLFHRQHPTALGGMDSFYGVALGGELDISTDAFAVSGVMYVESHANASGVYFGYSRGVESYTDGFEAGDAKNFIGVQLDDMGEDVIGIVWSQGGGRDRDLAVPDIPAGMTVPFSMDYNPNGNGGNGALAFNINGVAYTFNLPGGVKNDVQALTHFGIMPVSADGESAVMWLDDLRYTAVSLLIGDMDFDADIDFDDIDDFVLGLNNPTLYASIFGAAPSFHGDTDGDGDLDFDDIQGFVALLQGGQQAAIPEPTGVALLAAGCLTILLARASYLRNFTRARK